MRCHPSLSLSPRERGEGRARVRSTTGIVIDPHVAAGLFHATYRLARDGRFEEGERLWFEEEMEWFNRFLPATRALPTWRASDFVAVADLDWMDNTEHGGQL